MQEAEEQLDEGQVGFIPEASAMTHKQVLEMAVAEASRRVHEATKYALHHSCVLTSRHHTACGSRTYGAHHATKRMLHHSRTVLSQTSHLGVLPETGHMLLVCVAISGLGLILDSICIMGPLADVQHLYSDQLNKSQYCTVMLFARLLNVLYAGGHC